MSRTCGGNILCRDFVSGYNNAPRTGKGTGRFVFGDMGEWDFSCYIAALIDREMIRALKCDDAFEFFKVQIWCYDFFILLSPFFMALMRRADFYTSAR